MNENFVNILNKTENIFSFPPISKEFGGNDFFNKKYNNHFDRESKILECFLNGNIPSHLKKIKVITETLGNNVLHYFVLPDYLSLGNDDDFIRTPMSPLTAQTIADNYNATLITKKMVDSIYKQADYKLEAFPLGPPYDSSMASSERYITHNNKIKNQLINQNYNFSGLIAGHKKDVIITNDLAPNNSLKKVCIYGWFTNQGKVIQQKNSKSHEINYVDYSHGIRLASKIAYLNNEKINLNDIMLDNELCHLVSDEGVLKFLEYR